MTVEDDLDTIFHLIKDYNGHDFSTYKESTMYRRITKRANALQMNDLKKYGEYIRSNPGEIDVLFQDILINVTRFFRDPEAFNIIKNETLPELVSNKKEGDTVRIWVPGCSNGEEVYSLAMLLWEVMESTGKNLKVQIFGTDVDEDSIQLAAKRVYPEVNVEDIDDDLRHKFFEKVKEGYQIKGEIGDMTVFSMHNVLKDPPFTDLDMISCRNLLIYLKSNAQKIVLSAFNNALKQGGVLFLGPSESIGESMNSFEIFDKKWKIFKSTRPEPIPTRLVESHLKKLPGV